MIIVVAGNVFVLFVSIVVSLDFNIGVTDILFVPAVGGGFVVIGCDFVVERSKKQLKNISLTIL